MFMRSLRWQFVDQSRRLKTQLFALVPSLVQVRSIYHSVADTCWRIVDKFLDLNWPHAVFLPI